VATRTASTNPTDDPVTQVEDPAIPDKVEGRKYDPRKKVYVYDNTTGEKLPNPVPETWLDGRFPNLSETPSKKAGK
jgi:hypothetical protein